MNIQAMMQNYANPHLQNMVQLNQIRKHDGSNLEGNFEQYNSDPHRQNKGFDPYFALQGPNFA